MIHIKKLLLISCIMILSPSIVFAGGLDKFFKVNVRLSAIKVNELKIVHSKSKIGTQLRIFMKDRTLKNWHLQVGPTWETKKFIISSLTTFDVTDVFLFEELKFQQKQFIPALVLKSKFGLWSGRIGSRYFLSLQKDKYNAFLNEIELGRKTKFLGKGFSGGKMILRTYPGYSDIYTVDLQMKSNRQYQSFVNYISFVLGYQLSLQNNQPISGRLYFSIKFLI